MKIKILDQTTKKPLANGKLQLQIRGKDSGYLTTTTDANGYCTLDDNLNGQQIALANTSGGGEGGQGQWIQATEGATLYTTTTGTTTGTKTTTTTK